MESWESRSPKPSIAAMANPPKPWKVEYAKSSRSSCKSCKKPIDKDKLRFGKMVAATQFDGFMPMWNHADCIFKKGNQIKTIDDVEGIDLLRWEDQQKLRKYAEGTTSNASNADANKCTIEVSQTSRAGCRSCNQKITKGQVRVSTQPDGSGSKGIVWHHVNCFIKTSPATNIEKLPGWDSVSAQDRVAICAIAQGSSTSKNASKVEAKCSHEKHLQQSTSKGTKRKATTTGDHKNKIKKSEGNNSASTVSANLESKLEEQTKAIWAIKDDLRRHVTTGELREMLEANEQDSTGSEHALRDRCSDGMLFGTLDRCPICSGPLQYSGGEYRCHGYVSAWSKCAYSTTEPVRLKGKWKIPEETSNQYLLKWFKSQKGKKPDRILPPQSSRKSSGGEDISSPSQLYKGEKLEELKVAIAGVPKELMVEWKNKIEEHGGTIHTKIKKDTNCLVISGELDDHETEMRKARRMKIPIVRDDYLVECIKKQRRIPFEQYKIEAVSEASRNSVVTVKVKGRSAVHESSGLQNTGHILEDGRSIYNTTLSMSDLSTGMNSYYILQIIQDDKGSDCYVFRKWGRVGNDKIGGCKLDEMSKSDAIPEFKRLFLEKTGNTWEAWEQKQNFKKHPGRFFPLDIDYGVSKGVPKKKDHDKSQLAPQLAELMKLLFNVETYRAAMVEFEINMLEMPLGKLSKSSIQKGFEALTEIQNLLSNSQYDPSVKDSLIVDASNRFFTMIPSIHPHAIRDEDDFKSKVKMLEALQDIEVASRIVGFDVENDESLDDKYMKLHCNIAPLPHDSADYKMVEKYLLTTHAPTHKDWTLELEDVFALEREREFDEYAPYRDKLRNRMLLWHGSRLTNFVGILNQGLRIAPPEAPTTGYMFGKGIYFADLVSKSAQYCYTDKQNPVGLLLLSEVALGNIYELKKASYMDSPPQGKHSTKGLGKKKPEESEYIKWKEQVVVPCGQPVASSVRSSELMYNEYIVYNKAQVKMQFLVKVRFHHKR